MKRTKLVVSLAMSTFCLCFLIVGVLSSTTLSFNINSSLNYIPELPYRIEEENIGGKDYTFVYFGRYPQTYVGDELNTTLENLFDTSSSSLVATGKTFAAYDERVSKMPYIEYEYNGEEYVRVPEADVYNYATKTFNDGTTIVNSETYWFKVEQIKWRVLTNNFTDSGNTEPLYYLLSEFCLNSNIPFNVEYNSNYAAPSNILSSFLNEEFYNDAFITTDEKNLILTRILKASDLETSSTTPENTDPLKIWAPTKKDIINNIENNSERRSSPTDFVTVNYANKSSYAQDIHGLNSCSYWCSSALSGLRAYYIWADGVYSGDPVDFLMPPTSYISVRPALLFKPN